MEIKIIIPEDKIEHFKAAFKEAVPRPPKYEDLTDEQFLRIYMKDVLRSIERSGLEIKGIKKIEVEDYIEVK